MNHNMNYRRELKDKTFLLNRYKRNTLCFLFLLTGITIYNEKKESKLKGIKNSQQEIESKRYDYTLFDKRLWLLIMDLFTFSKINFKLDKQGKSSAETEGKTV